MRRRVAVFVDQCHSTWHKFLLFLPGPGTSSGKEDHAAAHYARKQNFADAFASSVRLNKQKTQSYKRNKFIA